MKKMWYPCRRRQRGVAVVIALLVASLAVILVTDLFWRQEIAVRTMEGQRQHLRGRLVVRAALDAACLMLSEAAARRSVTTLDGAWAAPIRESLLERFFDPSEPADAYDRAPGTYQASLSQRIEDAQARFNLRNLATADGKVNPWQVAAFARLLTTLGQQPELALRAADAVIAGRDGGSTLAILRIEDLREAAGFSWSTLETLRDFVVVLPEPTPVNVNTASAEVLTSVADFSLKEARELASRRGQVYFKDTGDFAFRLNQRETLEGVPFQVSSDYFLVTSTLRMAGASMETQALIRREQSRASASLVWLREQ